MFSGLGRRIYLLNLNLLASAGIRDFYQKDFCGTPVWLEFKQRLEDFAISLRSDNNTHALSEFTGTTLKSLIQGPDSQFSCSTALASASRLLAVAYERQGNSIRSLRALQVASIFAAYDFQMKGQEWIDNSAWPIRWTDSIDEVVRTMQAHILMDRNRDFSARTLTSGITPVRGMRIAIVSVCDYDPRLTPLGSLSFMNKQQYAKKHRYELILYNKAPQFQDYFTDNGGIYPSRPHAWSKIDALLKAMVEAEEDTDWIMWMDCDSFFLDQDVALEQMIAAAEQERAVVRTEDDKRMSLDNILALSKWVPEDSREAVSSYEEVARAFVRAESDITKEHNPTFNCTSEGDPLLTHSVTELIASEDGLMLNTGIFFARRSVFAYYFLWKVRALTFGHHPITFHPWWEQTGMMMLIALPFVFDDTLWALTNRHGVGPYVSFLSQKQLNTYPPMIAGMLRTHAAYSPGDFIISFSGCRVYTSQSVCNHLFMEYFLKAAGARIPQHIVDEFNEY